MNCKPGDLAFVIKDLKGVYNDIEVTIVKQGTIVKVLYLTRSHPGREMWKIEPHIPFKATVGDKIISGDVTDVFDSYLRPISNPDDSEKDETLLWLPVPNEDLINEPA